MRDNLLKILFESIGEKEQYGMQREDANSRNREERWSSMIRADMAQKMLVKMPK